MCGYFYSNTLTPRNDDLLDIKRRGPDAFNVVLNDNGFFAHALLITKPPRTTQPANSTNKHGTMLYNGSIYNVDGNDTVWLTDKLDDNIDTCLQLIRSLRGEYSITWVTDKFIIFCTDQWGTRNLYYYFSEKTGELSTASLPGILRKKHGVAYPCTPNTIYVVEKKSFFGFNRKMEMRLEINTTWNLNQFHDNYDRVFDEFESSLSLRTNARHAFGLSSGYDSGVMACAYYYRIKTFKPHYFSIYKNENTQLLNLRREMVDSASLRDRPFNGELVKNFRNSFGKVTNATPGRLNWFDIACNWGIDRGQRIHIMGRGGDELYADYGHKGVAYAPGSMFGGCWPEDLQRVWPWHTGRGYLYEACSLQDFSFGYFGCEPRVPLLDQKLVQAWLNTTQRLKNARYKGWMAEYMDLFKYPYIENEKLAWGGPF